LESVPVVFSFFSCNQLARILGEEELKENKLLLAFFSLLEIYLETQKYAFKYSKP
jgi:hypothetical protein